MPISPVDTHITPLLSKALRSLLVGIPSIPAQPSTDEPSPLSKLMVLGLSGLQFFLYVVSAIGGITLWAWAWWHGLRDPLQGSPWILSLALEGWCLAGMVLGSLILFIGRRWAIASAVEWGWMGIRLGLLIFLTLFATYLLTELKHDVTISLITGLCLLIPAPLFWQLGFRTIDTILALSPEDFQVRRKHHLSGENRIFLSYRRADSQPWTDRIGDDLKEHFGSRAVFQDVEDVPAGVDYRQHLAAQLDKCQVVLTIIGPEWLTIKDEQGNRRLDHVRDMVRLEIEVALQRKIPIIPLLINSATMPSEDKLPATIRELAFQNSLTIRGNPDFRKDMSRLIQVLETYVR